MGIRNHDKYGRNPRIMKIRVSQEPPQILPQYNGVYPVDEGVYSIRGAPLVLNPPESP